MEQLRCQSTGAITLEMVRSPGMREGLGMGKTLIQAVNVQLMSGRD